MPTASIHEIPTLPSPIAPTALPDEGEEAEPPTLRRVPFDEAEERFFREPDEVEDVEEETPPEDARLPCRPLVKPVGVVVIVAALVCLAAVGRSLPAAAATAIDRTACVDARAR